MRLKGRKQSSNVQKIKSPRERDHHNRHARRSQIKEMIFGQSGNPDTSIAKKMGVGFPSSSNIKGDRLKKAKGDRLKRKK